MSGGHCNTWAAVWMLVFDIIVPKQTMFTTDGCQLGVPSSRLGLAGLENPYITRICVARPEGLEPPTF
ncbi:MAG: hypothetical protein DRJ28_07045 [Actinobacteria bacterium]|nr:MAG: hypothetical protein DRJ28_07045 [Actinomycetota bacterium]